MGELIGLVTVCLIFGIPLTAIWTEHKRKILEMQLRLQSQGDVGLRAEVEALRQEVHSLRDTAMQYDLSFDAALQRMEQRVGTLEEKRSYVSSTPREETVVSQLGN